MHLLTEVNSAVNQTPPIVIKQDVRVEGESDDIYAELKKLKELLDAKIITQDEFDVRKTKILAQLGAQAVTIS